MTLEKKKREREREREKRDKKKEKANPSKSPQTSRNFISKIGGRLMLLC